MPADIDALARPSVGPVGVWRSEPDLSPALAIHLEALGFGAIWIGGSPAAGLTLAEELLDATRSITVATGIVNIWNSDAVELAASYNRIVAKHPGRFLLGIGAGHPESTGAIAEKPYGALVQYLDVLDDGGVPPHGRVLAALGPRVLRLARDRTAGAHPYLVTPEHTKRAREILGAGPLLAPEQRVVLRSDPAEARAVGRPSVQKPYLGLVNYRNNLLRLGYTEQDLADGGSDALIDDLVVSGDDARIAARLTEHLAAGADHVAVQLLTAPGDDVEDGFTRIAQALGLHG